MTVSKGNQKIRERSTFGIYKGNQPIKQIYKGSQLVYQYESYNPNQQLVNVTNGNTASITLKKGVYQLYITGGGGSGGVHYAGDGYFFTTSGGSGSTWEGIFYLSKDTPVEVFGCGNNADSYININGTRMITAGGGRATSYGSSQPQGGTLNLASGWSFYVVATQKSTNGNGGSQSVAVIPNGGATTSSLKWGEGTTLHTDGAVQYGGVRIVYLRYER